MVGQPLGGDRAEERGVLVPACCSWQPGIALAIAHLTFPDDKNVLPAILLPYLVVGALVAAPYLRWIKR